MNERSYRRRWTSYPTACFMFKTEPAFVNDSMDNIISMDLDVLSYNWQMYFYGRTDQIETPLVSRDGGIDVYRYQSIS